MSEIGRDVAFWSTLTISNIWFAVDENTIAYMWLAFAALSLFLMFLDLLKAHRR